MAGPLIAIVGSHDPAREQELDLKNGALVHDAGEYLGRELARQGFRIVVYSSLPHTLELDVVRGYVAQGNTEPGSIQVLFSQAIGQATFPEEKGHEDTFEFLPDFNPDWEYSFYQSLAQVDGMLILGGGPTALIAGLVALGHQKPVLACAAFGGSGDKLWRALRTQSYPLTDGEFGLMAQTRWSPELAGKLVALLHKQRAEFARREEQRRQDEEKRLAERRRQELAENATINWHAIVSALLFALAAFTWPLSMLVPKDRPFLTLCVVLFTPMLAGASGATIRVVLDWAVGVTRTFALSTYNQSILLRFAALGLVAGGVAGVSFVLAQLFASELDPEDLGASLRKLVPFVIVIGFAAGLTAEVVLSNVRKSGAPTVEVPGAKPKS